MDFKTITKLAEIMKEFGLNHLAVTEKDFSVTLGKDAPVQTVVTSPANIISAVNASGNATEATANATAEPVYIKSPMPGTFYNSTSPASAPLVKAGDKVSSNTVVCIVEAMKVMNEVKAEVSGVILRQLVEDGSPVEYGQPLFEIGR